MVMNDKKEKRKMMFDFLVLEPLRALVYILQMSVFNIANVIELVMPYGMYLIGQYVCSYRESVHIGGEILVPILILLVTSTLKRYARMQGFVKSMLPVPRKRFTEVYDDGEVTVKQEDVQEMILYMADLEDYLQRTGRLRVDSEKD